MMKNDADVIIIGAGYAGLSAALFLGNARRKVLLLDGGPTRNWDAGHVYNLLGSENKNPKKILEKGLSEVSNLPSVHLIQARASNIQQLDNLRFRVTLDDDMQIDSGKLILATGVVDIMPNISGAKSFWQKNLFHCPYCIAPELIDAPLGVVCETDEAFFLTSIVQKWTNDLILFTSQSKILCDNERKKLLSRKIKVITESITKFSGEPGTEIILNFDKCPPISRRGIFMHLPTKQRAEDIINQLSIATTQEGLVKVTETFQTNIEGIYAIGDMAQLVQKVATAISSGSIAGFDIDHQLTLSEMQK